MRKSLGTLVCLAAVLVGLESVRPAAAEKTPAAVQAATGPITVRADRPGNRVPVWGYDIKQSCPLFKPRRCRSFLPVKRLNTQPRYLKAVFGSGRMNLIRIPLRADRRGVRGNGLVKARYYRPVIRATKKAMGARLGHGLIVFANRVTVNDCPIATPNRPVRCPDFAPSLKSKGNVVPAKYARLLQSYLRLFRRNGVRIDVLGIENEPSNNEGRMLRDDKYTLVVKSLKRQYGGRLPRLAMIDSGNPRPGWFRSKGRQPSRAGDAWNVLDFATTHYSSRKRSATRDALGRLARVARGKGVRAGRKGLVPWDTEFHWNDIDHLGPYGDARQGLFSAFDHVDFGYRGVVWWAFSPGKKRGMQRTLVDTAARAPRLPVPGWNHAARPGKISIRAFRRGDRVFVWVVNDTRRSRTGQSFHIEGARLGGPSTYVRWSQEGRQLVRDTGRASGLFWRPQTSLPARSITLLRIPVR